MTFLQAKRAFAKIKGTDFICPQILVRSSNIQHVKPRLTYGLHCIDVNYTFCLNCNMVNSKVFTTGCASLISCGLHARSVLLTELQSLCVSAAGPGRAGCTAGSVEL